MDETPRKLIAIALGLAFVIWQARQEPGRSFAAILIVAAFGYAFAPTIRDGVTG